MKYVLAIDQSTQGSKLLLVNENGEIAAIRSKPHRQIIDKNGYISHDMSEIYANILALLPEIISAAGIDKSNVIAVGITNQRETTVLFGKDGRAAPAVVWHCSRGAEITDNLKDYGDIIRKATGLPLSPYFSAAKMAWLIKRYGPVQPYMLGTVDSYLIYKLTGNFYTDYSNAARTQLFNINTLEWDNDLCKIFGVPQNSLPKVIDSDGNFGYTDFEGFFDNFIPVCAVSGDSNAAMYAHGCFKKGEVKATYGTGTSVMMNTGNKVSFSENGLSASIAWKTDGKVSYVAEGNVNYSAAVISWLINDLGLLSTPDEAEKFAREANPLDCTVLVPAFSGLSAPYWNSSARAAITGMSRTTGKKEIVKAAVEAIAFQINDVLVAMQKDNAVKINKLCADGGAAKNGYLMQFQSDLSGLNVFVPSCGELSAMGVALMAGKKFGIARSQNEVKVYCPSMAEKDRKLKSRLWEDAVSSVLKKEKKG